MKKKHISNKRILRALAAAAFLALPATQLSAATLTWDGSDASWESASNWLLDGSASSRTPTNGDTVNVDSGTITTTYSLNLYAQNVSQTGGKIVVTGSDYTLHSGTVVNHTGGTLAFASSTSGNRWFNIGETAGKKAYYYLDGGTLENVKQFYVGRRGEGHMTIANSDVVVDTLSIGYAVRLSGDSDITLNSGSLTANWESRIGGENAQSGDTDYLGTSSLIINGGAFTNKGILHVGNFKFGTTDGITQKSAVTQTGGNWVSEGVLYLGSGNASGKDENIVNVKLSGGSAEFQKSVHLGHAAGSNVTMTVSDSANVDFQDIVYLGETANSTSVMNLNGGTTNFSKELYLGWTANAVGTLNINGGTNAFNNKVVVGSVGPGNLNISADVKFTQELLVGDKGTGTMTVTGGMVNFDLTNACFYVGSNSGNGTLNLSGGSIAFNTGYDVMIGHSNGTGVVNQTGGTFTSYKWINIGENGSGTWNISGGQLNAKNNLAVGRRGPGILNISGSADVNAGSVFVGAFPQLSAAGSELNVSGGALDGSILYVGGNPDYAENCKNIKSSSMTVTGGTVTFTQDSYVGHHGKDGSGGNGVMNIAGGTASFAKDLYVGYGVNGIGALNVSDGSITAQTLKLGDNGNGTLTISGGELHTTNGDNHLGSYGSAVVNVTGGTLTFDKTTFLGRGNSSASAEMTITGGTVNGPSNGDFRLGTDNAKSKLVVDGGTLNNRYNLVIDANSNGETGTLVELKSGTIKTPWFSLGQNGFGDNPHNTFNMSGGSLEVTKDLRLGYKYYSDVNISGGSISVSEGTARLAHDGSNAATEAGATLNILGSASTWDLNKLEWESSGKVNFTAQALELNADGTMKAPVSTISVKNSAIVDSAISVDTSDFYYDGAVFLSAVPETTLFSASSLTWNPNALTVEGQWTLEKKDNSIILALDESAIGKADFSGDVAQVSGILGENSWIVLSGAPKSDVDLILDVTGNGDIEQLADWLNLQMDDLNSNVAVEATDSLQIAFTNIALNEDGLAFMNYDLSAFNLANGASFEFKNNVPEPGTWILLATGMGLLFLKRKRS